MKSARKTLLSLVGSAILACLSAPGLADQSLLLEVQAGGQDRQDVAVFAELPAAVSAWPGFQLTDLSTGRSVSAQFDVAPPHPAAKPRLAWLLGERLAAGQTRKFRLMPATVATVATAEAAPAVAVRRDERSLRVEVEGKPVLCYHQAVVPSDDPQEPAYARSGFIHPVFDPAGQVLTDGMPPDHMHQHGIMFAWVDTLFEGRPVDFWNSKKHQGEIRHVDLVETRSGPVWGSFTAKLDHVDLTAPGGPKVALHETWVVRVYRAAEGFLFDLQSTQTCAGPSPLQIRKYDYGGMAIRGAREWFGPGKCEFLTSEGKTLADGNHTRARWCDVCGSDLSRPAGGHGSGITVFCHPQNFAFPQPLRLHPTKPYFCWAPMVPGPFAIEPGKPYLSAYRYYVHQGKLDAAVAERLWNDFADPPQVRVVQP